VDAADWSFDAKRGVIVVQRTTPFHLYSANVLVYQIWDSTSMYNALTNNWKGEHPAPVDPYQPEVFQYLLGMLDRWLAANPKTTVVRFTSVAYHFTNIYNDKAEPRYRDWSGYTDCLSPLALEDFARKKGYALTAEDLLSAGTFNGVDRPPTKAYLDWIDFINEFVATKLCPTWTDKVHRAGKKAMMFFCDHWIGTEPYGERFPQTGFDALVNACRNGIEARRIGDVPGKLEKEARLYPYFFPVNLENKPSFAPGGNPRQECIDFWIRIRRAFVRKLLDRVGFGGYPGLALKFPDFIDYAGEMLDEFRLMHKMTRQTPPNAPAVKVAVLNAWGKRRSWICREFAYGGMMEALSGLAVDVTFLSFDDIERNGIPSDVDVLINTGDEGTAWSGGENWRNPIVTTRIREFIHRGGGFLGVGEPSAAEYQGKFFQLCDVLGVDREAGLSKNKSKPRAKTEAQHFILEDQPAAPDLGYMADFVFPATEQTRVLAQDGQGVRIAVNEFGKGRAVYLAGFKFSWPNVRLLARALHWAARKESDMKKWFSTNLHTECGAFSATGKCIVINNTDKPQSTTVFDDRGRSLKLDLAPQEGRWLDIASFR
jgi:1,3-beta-galactosyl-N-acetylhexosamine phosphorylase